MNSRFHRILNRMVIFIALIAIGIIMFFDEFIRICATAPWLNGIILGCFLFGTILCFVHVFQLLPEYRWMKRFFVDKKRDAELPPYVLKPVAKMLVSVRQQNKPYISSQTLQSFLSMIMDRFEDQREQVRYITNVLIFLGLLGTFWGLLHTIQSFSDILASMTLGADSDPSAVFDAMRETLLAPLSGMGTAFSSSFLGLSGSLIVGFLALQASLAQNVVYRELEEQLADQTKLFGYLGVAARGEETVLTYIQSVLDELSGSVQMLEKSLGGAEKTSMDTMRKVSSMASGVTALAASTQEKTLDLQKLAVGYFELKPVLEKLIHETQAQNKMMADAMMQMGKSMDNMTAALPIKSAAAVRLKSVKSEPVAVRPVGRPRLVKAEPKLVRKVGRPKKVVILNKERGNVQKKQRT